MGARNRPKMTHKLGKPNAKHTNRSTRQNKNSTNWEDPKIPRIPQRDTSPRRGESAKKKRSDGKQRAEQRKQHRLISKEQASKSTTKIDEIGKYNDFAVLK